MEQRQPSLSMASRVLIFAVPSINIVRYRTDQAFERYTDETYGFGHSTEGKYHDRWLMEDGEDSFDVVAGIRCP